MKLPSILKKVSMLEIVLFVVFVIYLISGVPTPRCLAPFIDTPLGILIMFAITVYLFFNMNPLLGILYIFVAYELLRRSQIYLGSQHLRPSLQLAPEYKETEIEVSTPAPYPSAKEPETLEEHVVSQMGPIGNGAYIETSFSPVADNIRNASYL
jgi:hypothetical protein